MRGCSCVENLSPFEGALANGLTVTARAKGLNPSAIAIAALEGVVFGEDDAQVVGTAALKETCEACHEDAST